MEIYVPNMMWRCLISLGISWSDKYAYLYYYTYNHY